MDANRISIYAAGGGDKSGSAAQGSTQEDPNTLLSISYVRFVALICEGEIEGLVDGGKSVFLNNTPLVGDVAHGSSVQKDNCSWSAGSSKVYVSSGANALAGISADMTVTGGGMATGAKVAGISSVDNVVYVTPAALSSGSGSLTFTQPTTANNFSDFTLLYRYGTQTQDHIPGFDSVETQVDGVSSNNEITHDNPAIFTVTDTNANAVRVTIATPQFEYQKIEDNNVSLIGTSVQYAIEAKSSTGNWTQVVSDAFTGKCTSPYLRSHRFDLPTDGPGPWTIRISRVTADTTNSAISDKLFPYDAFSLVDVKLSYPNSVVFAGQFDAKQFSSIPNVSLYLKLLKVQVPTNYDPITRTYATTGAGTSGGVWDGTFKVAWTDNPAWCYRDLIISNRYGLGNFVKLSAPDKWELYEIAQYCDELVPDGYGGMEPRFTCNLFIQSREEAYRVVANFASIFRGIVFWASGNIRLVQDSPRDPEIVLGPADVVDGRFTYIGTSVKTRHSVALVTWNDPSQQSISRVEYVEDREAVRTQGIFELELTAFGCASRGMARRVGRWALYAEQNETEVVSFEAGLAQLDIYPGQIIQIFDPVRAGKRLSGRMKGSTTTTIDLDGPIDMVSGKSYTISFTDSNGALVSRNLVNAAANGVTTVTVTSALNLSELPLPNASWAIAVNDLQPQTFRVIGADEGDTPFTVKVNALEYNSGKFDWIEKDIPFDDPPITSLPNSSASVVPPSNFVVKENVSIVPEGLERYLNCSWTHSTDPLLLDYTVSYRFGNGNWISLPNTDANQLDFTVRDQGDYLVRICANNRLGRRSEFVYAGYDLGEVSLDNGSITGLELFNQGNDTEFSGPDAHFVWRYNSPSSASETGGLPNPLLQNYVLELYDARYSPPVFLRREEVPTAEYIYTHAKNVKDTGNKPTRKITIYVAARDLVGHVSNAATLTVNNPQPLIGNFPPLLDTTKIRISSKAGQLLIHYDAPSDPDFSGLLIFGHSGASSLALDDVRDPATYTPKDSALVSYSKGGPLLYAGKDTAINLPISSLSDYTLIFAPYDEFGYDGINWYGPINSRVIFTVDTTPPETPSGLIVTSDVATLPDGTQKIVINARFLPNTESDLSVYSWKIRRASGTPAFDESGNLTGYTGTYLQRYDPITGIIPARTESGGFVVNSDGYLSLQWEVEAATYYEVQVAAVDTSGNVSAYTPLTENNVILTHADTIPPGIPEWVSLSAAFRLVTLKWVKPDDADYYQTRIYESTDPDFATYTEIRVSGGDTEEIQYNLVGQLSSNTRYYRLKGEDSSGNLSAFSDIRSITFDELVEPKNLTLNTEVVTDEDGTQQVWLTASWVNDNTNVEARNFHWQLGDSPSYGLTSGTTQGTSLRFPVTGNVLYYFRVRTEDSHAGFSAWVSDTITSAKDTIPPGKPTSLAAGSGISTVFLDWTNPTDSDFAGCVLYRTTVETYPVEEEYADVGTSSSFIDSDVEQGKVYYYRLRAKDTSGNFSLPSSWVSVTPGKVENSDIEDFAVTLTKQYNSTIALESDSWSSQSPVPLSVAWNAHKLYYRGAAYDIAAGSTSLKYIYWDSIDPNVYQTSATNPSLTDSQFLIATNVSGYYDLAWNAVANEMIGTAHIQNLAVTDAKISTLAVEKLLAGTITAKTFTLAPSLGVNAVFKTSNYNGIVDSTGTVTAPGTAGLFFNSSGYFECGSARIRGDIVAGTITIGENENVFKVDATGNVWLGASLRADARVKLDASGNFQLGPDANIKLSFDASTGVLYLPNVIQVGGAASDINSNATTISGTKITVNTLSGDRIYAGSITADKVQARTLTGDRLVIGTVTADEIAANAITAEKIGANLVITNSANIGTGVITNAHIVSLNADKINAGTMTSMVFVSAKTANNSQFFNSSYGTGSTFPARSVLRGSDNTAASVNGTSYISLLTIYGWATGSGFSNQRFGSSTVVFEVFMWAHFNISTSDPDSGNWYGDAQAVYRINGSSWVNSTVSDRALSDNGSCSISDSFSLSGLASTDVIEFGVKLSTSVAQDYTNSRLTVAWNNV